MNISAVSPATPANTLVSQTGPAQQTQGTSAIAKEELVETRAAEFSEPLSKQVLEGEVKASSSSAASGSGRLDIYA